MRCPLAAPKKRARRKARSNGQAHKSNAPSFHPTPRPSGRASHTLRTLRDLKTLRREFELTQSVTFPLLEISSRRAEGSFAGVGMALGCIKMRLPRVGTAFPGEEMPLRAGVNALRGCATSKRAGVTSLHRPVSALRGDVMALRGSVTALRGGVTALRRGVMTLPAGVMALRGDVTALRRKCEAHGKGERTSLPLPVCLLRVRLVIYGLV